MRHADKGCKTLLHQSICMYCIYGRGGPLLLAFEAYLVKGLFSLSSSVLQMPTPQLIVRSSHFLQRWNTLGPPGLEEVFFNIQTWWIYKCTRSHCLISQLWEVSSYVAFHLWHGWPVSRPTIYNQYFTDAANAAALYRRAEFYMLDGLLLPLGPPFREMCCTSNDSRMQIIWHTFILAM